jgi:uroporphyrinogen-III synthase
VVSDLSDLKEVFYDIIVFFSPSSVQSLYDNFPDFEQNETRLAAFGPATQQALLDRGLILDIVAPTPEAPSMTMAVEQYIINANK